MPSKVFSISIYQHPGDNTVGIFRTDGSPDGGAIRFYNLTVPRLIRLLRAMVNVSKVTTCYTFGGDLGNSWYIPGVVEQMYAAQAALAAA